MQKLHDHAVHQALVVDSNMAGSLGRILATELFLFITYQHEFCFFACSGGNESTSA